eukprot:scaffold52144_cov33-Tisochrysis_lutea.AAC.2
MAALHSSLASGKKISQRELWYHLKPLGIFETAAQVYERIVEVCTVISAWSGFACPREALGVIASARGSMAGALTLVKPEGPQILDRAVHAIPGDPEECLALRFLESRARCVIVVEKDTVFFRLVQDGFIQIMPCVLITSCVLCPKEFDAIVCRSAHFDDHSAIDYRTHRMASQVLDIPCFALTDYNPHGIALMLNYKFGSVSVCACPKLLSAHIYHLEASPADRSAASCPPSSCRTVLYSKADQLSCSNVTCLRLPVNPVEKLGSFRARRLLLS